MVISSFYYDSPVPGPIEIASSGPYGLRLDETRSLPLYLRGLSPNASHPSLHFKKLEGEHDIYPVRIGLGYRALAIMKGNRLVWYWIGTHSESDRLV